MYSADDLIGILRRRRTLKSIRPEVPGQLPPAWEAWVSAPRGHPGAVAGAPPGAFVDQLLLRAPASPPRRSATLTRLQAFSTLWRQQWEPARRDERGLRVFAMVASIVSHIGLAVAMAWLMYLHLLLLLQVPPPTGEAAVVQVEYIGTGTPDTPGGGAGEPAPADTPAPRAATAGTPEPAAAPPMQVQPVETQAPAPELSPPPVEIVAPAVATAAPPVPTRDVPTPVPPVEQPLQVTEVDRPDISFVLPPPTPPSVEVRSPALDVATREVPAPEEVVAMEADLEAPAPTVAVDAPPAARPALSVPTRAVPAPEAAEVPRLPRQAVAAPEVSAPTVATRAPAVPVAAIPEPPGRPDAASGAPDADAAAGEAEAVADSGDGSEASVAARDDGVAAADTAPADGAGANQPVAGAGPDRWPAPGGWPSPNRGDDWDDALRNRDGGLGEGGDGLADTGAGGPPGGAPPGSEARQAIDLERGGTWLQRPPLDYRPTRFDAFWIPSGTLLEEWVRRGIKQMSIPIPGTSMEIVCVVSILQLGGGCGLSNPNINEQPSSGRPPPEVPFKPELQEDPGSLASPPGA